MKNHLIIVGTLLFAFLAGLLLFPINYSGDVQISANKSLQLGTIKFASPTVKPPTSTPTRTTQPTPSLPPSLVCPVDYKNEAGNFQCIARKSCGNCPAGNAIIKCNMKTCTFEDTSGAPELKFFRWPKAGNCTTFGADLCKTCDQEDGIICWGKPVILLYPEKPTLVDVEVVTSGEIFISDPLYPAGGWKNVLANPDGSLIYHGKPYKELFYESKVKNYGPPPTGLVFKTSELEEKLTKLLYNLGLEYDIPTEIPEFMDFWLPKLKNLDSPYIFVSLIPHEQKEANDKVIINPEPDTRIEIIVYFKPLNELIPVEPLEVGTRPVRHGFTMVEWGGTIDTN